MPSYENTPIEALKEQFKLAVQNHDVTYEYSDDGSVYRRGSQQKAEIFQMAQFLPIDFVKEVWNARMDKCLIPSEAPRWYWKG